MVEAAAIVARGDVGRRRRAEIAILGLLISSSDIATLSAGAGLPAPSPPNFLAGIDGFLATSHSMIFIANDILRASLL